MASSKSSEPPLQKESKTKTWCSALNCSKNKRSNPELIFFRFPSDPARYCKLFGGPQMIFYFAVHVQTSVKSRLTYKFKMMYCRSKEWVNLCRRADLMDKTPKYLYNNCKLCSNHFEDCMFYNALRNRLKSDAKPTLFEIPNPPPTVSSKRRRLPREQTFTGPPGNSTC